MTTNNLCPLYYKTLHSDKLHVCQINASYEHVNGIIFVACSLSDGKWTNLDWLKCRSFWETGKCLGTKQNVCHSCFGSA